MTVLKLSMGYTTKAISGFTWQTFFKITAAVVVIGKVAVLARLLTPSDFGLISLTMIALGITEAATETGINLTILQSRHSIRYFLDTAWVISIIRGFLIGIVMIVMGLGLSHFMQKEELLFLITVAALVPIIKGFINPSIILLQKKLHFHKEAFYRLTLLLIETSVALILGFILRSALAVILAILLTAIFEVGLSFIVGQEKPKFFYLSSRAKAIFANTKWLSLSALLSYINENSDDLLIGKLLGTHNLGLYHNAYALSHKSTHDLAKAAHHSTLPIFTKFANNKQRLWRAFKKSFLATLMLTLAGALPLILFPHFFVNLVLGDQWLSVVPYVRWLVLAGFIQSISLATYSLFFTRKRYKIITTHLGLNVVFLVTLFIIFIPKWQLLGAVVGLFIARLVSTPVLFYGVYSYRINFKK